MKVIQLTKGQVAIVDDQDFDKIAQYQWSYGPKGYATRRVIVDGRRVRVQMHREILGLGKKDPFVDHKNMNPLDNRRENLRAATMSQNRANSRARSDNKLGVKGVTQRGRKFSAQINVNGKNRKLGTFNTPEEASAAYFNAAVEAHGQFARAN